MKINWTFLAGLLLAGISLTFSATGLTHLFAGAGIAIPIMAIAFELAKVTGTVWLMNRTQSASIPNGGGDSRSSLGGRLTTWLLCSGLLTAVLALSAVSSLGTYGYLTRSYRTGRAPASTSLSNSTTAAASVAKLEADRDRFMKLVESVPDESPSAKRRLLQSVQPQIDKIDAQLVVARREAANAATSATKADADIGELKFAGDLLGTTEEGIVKLIVTTLAFLLDPLAVLLVMASGVKSKTAAEKRADIRRETWTGRQTTFAAEAAEEQAKEACTVPPEGWYCTREAGHEPPCAALPHDESLIPAEPPKVIRRPVIRRRFRLGRLRPPLQPALRTEEQSPNVLTAAAEFHISKPRSLGAVLDRVSHGAKPRVVANDFQRGRSN